MPANFAKGLLYGCDFFAYISTPPIFSTNGILASTSVQRYAYCQEARRNLYLPIAFNAILPAR
jgi:hypothetical protein